MPWFAAPGLKIAFFRPLSSALLWLDHALFGRWALPYHVHTLLWYAGLLAVAAALLRRALAPPLATLALLIFCLDEGHAMAAGWVAARNASVGCALVLLGLVAHLRWRAEGWRPGALLAPAAGALGLAASELALGALAYLVAWELAERRPHRGRALAPTLALAAVYLAVHRLGGSGTHASGGYLDPFGDTAGFLGALPGRVLLLLGSLVLGAPIDFLTVDEGLRPPLLIAGGAAALVLAWWLPRALRRMPADEARAVRWLALGAGGALLAGTPALLGERVLLAASLGGAAVLAALLRDAWRERRAPAIAGLLLLGLPNLPLALVAKPAKVALMGTIFDRYRHLAREAEIEAPVPARVVVLALDDLVAIHLPVLRVMELGWSAAELRAWVAGAAPPPLPDRIGYLGSSVLSLSSARHRLVRTAAGALELSTPDGTLLDGVWAETLRSPAIPLPRGSVILLQYMTVTVLDDRGGRPTRVRFELDRSLDDPSLVFLAPSGGGLRRVRPPPVGGELALPRAPPLALGGGG